MLEQKSAAKSAATLLAANSKNTCNYITANFGKSQPNIFAGLEPLYFCEDCECVFSAPKRITEDYGLIEKVCPNCGSGNYSKANQCEVCGTYISSHEDLCSSCKKEAEEKFKQILQENFSETQIDYLNDIYEDRYFGKE